MSWLPVNFVHPIRVDVCPGYHLRPIRADDTPIDYPAVMGSRESLWAKYGPTWGWPPATMTEEQDRTDLARHEREIAAHISFNYALFNEDETALFGCVYLDPTEQDDAEISWWVIDDLVGSDVQRAVDEFVPAWITSTWPFHAVRYSDRIGGLTTRFLRGEADHYVRHVIRDVAERRTSGIEELNFNAFNVFMDFDSGTVTVQHEFDAVAEESVPMPEFLTAVQTKPVS